MSEFTTVIDALSTPLPPHQERLLEWIIAIYVITRLTTLHLCIDFRTGSGYLGVTSPAPPIASSTGQGSKSVQGSVGRSFVERVERSPRTA